MSEWAYFGCCGRSKFRGHWEGCHRAARMEAQGAEIGNTSSARSATAGNAAQEESKP